jgi:uncharacterized protein YciI
MSTFAVIREAGPRWDHARLLRQQEAWEEHAEFMDSLAEQGFVLVGGPLAGGPKTLLIVDAPGETDIRHRLAADPWTPMGMLVVASVEPWEIFLGSAPQRTLA